MGRKLAGSEYSGDYHHRNIYDIRKSAERKFLIQQSKKILFPIILFEVYSCLPNDEINKKSLK